MQNLRGGQLPALNGEGKHLRCGRYRPDSHRGTAHHKMQRIGFMIARFAVNHIAMVHACHGGMLRGTMRRIHHTPHPERRTDERDENKQRQNEAADVHGGKVGWRLRLRKARPTQRHVAQP